MKSQNKLLMSYENLTKLPKVQKQFLLSYCKLCIENIQKILNFRNPVPIPTDLLDNVTWEPFTLKDQKYMDIGNKLVMHEKLHQERYAVWEKLYPLNQSSKTKRKGY